MDQILVHIGSDELILQNTEMTFHNGLEGRIQIFERHYRITLDLDTEAYSYPDNILNMAKPGLRVSSRLKKRTKKRIIKQVIYEREITSLLQLDSDEINRTDAYCDITIKVRLSDIMRPEVKRRVKEIILSNEDDLK